MVGEEAQSAAEDDPTRPDPRNGNGENGARLRSEFHQLELSMERLRADIVSEASGLKAEFHRSRRYMAERQVVTVTFLMIAVGAAIGAATFIWSPTSEPPPATSAVEQPATLTTPADTSSSSPEPQTQTPTEPVSPASTSPSTSPDMQVQERMEKLGVETR